MDGPRDYHSKRSKSDKNITYLWNLKKKKKMIQMNLLTNRNRLTDIAKKNTLLLPKGKGGRDKLGVWEGHTL